MRVRRIFTNFVVEKGRKTSIVRKVAPFIVIKVTPFIVMKVTPFIVMKVAPFIVMKFYLIILTY